MYFNSCYNTSHQSEWKSGYVFSKKAITWVLMDISVVEVQDAVTCHIHSGNVAVVTRVEKLLDLVFYSVLRGGGILGLNITFIQHAIPICSCSVICSTCVCHFAFLSVWMIFVTAQTNSLSYWIPHIIRLDIQTCAILSTPQVCSVLYAVSVKYTQSNIDAVLQSACSPTLLKTSTAEPGAVTSMRRASNSLSISKLPIRSSMFNTEMKSE